MNRYLDANIFLNAILYDDTKSKNCEKILRNVVKNEITGVTSFLTLDEVIHILKKNSGRGIAINEGKIFLKMPNLIFIDVNKKIITNAQKLFEKYNINPRDAIHAATALSHECTEIISDDSDFDIIKEIKRISPEKFK